MKELAPGDASLIEEFTNAIRRSSGLDMPVDNPNLLEGLEMGFKMLPLLGLFRKYTKTSVHDFAGGFSDPFLREAFVGSFGLPRLLPKTLPGLADSHMIGQWTTVGAGLPGKGWAGRGQGNMPAGPEALRNLHSVTLAS